MPAPRIALTRCRSLDDYTRALTDAGGEACVCDATGSVADALEGVAGVLLSGGEDVAPERYGEAPHPSVVVNPARDAFELALIDEARRRHLPLLAICRGIQVLNVACGGTLVQDIPSAQPDALPHRLAVPPHAATAIAHEVWVEPGTLLASVLRAQLTDGDTCGVNSRHHQAVARVATGFRVAAVAPDGIIEAIEDPRALFCVGVQWHPENFWASGTFRALFEAFVSAA